MEHNFEGTPKGAGKIIYSNEGGKEKMVKTSTSNETDEKGVSSGSRNQVAGTDTSTDTDVRNASGGKTRRIRRRVSRSSNSEPAGGTEDLGNDDRQAQSVGESDSTTIGETGESDRDTGGDRGRRKRGRPPGTGGTSRAKTARTGTGTGTDEEAELVNDLSTGSRPKRISEPKAEVATKNFTKRALKDSFKGISFLLASALGAHWIIDDEETQALTDATMAYVDSMPKNAKRKNFERLMRVLPLVALIGTASVVLVPRVTLSVEGVIRSVKHANRVKDFGPTSS